MVKESVFDKAAYQENTKQLFYEDHFLTNETKTTMSMIIKNKDKGKQNDNNLDCHNDSIFKYSCDNCTRNEWLA